MTTKHDPMTAEELAEARKLEQAATAEPWSVLDVREEGAEVLTIEANGSAIARIANVVSDKPLDEEDEANARFIAAARTLVPRLLATVDALTERAERAEAELSRMCRESMAYKQERDEALALAGARGRALAELRATVGGYLVCLSSGTADKGALRTAYGLSEIALALTAPEALRQQQEREAEMRSELGQIRHVLAGWAGELTDASVPIMGRDGYLTRAYDRLITRQQEREAGLVAMIEALRGALERISAIAEYDTSFGKAAAKNRYLVPYDEFEAMRELLKVTPPQALAQQREYVRALEMVAERARMLQDAGTDYYDYEALDKALSFLDALKKGK